MNRTERDEWTAALRSGNYRQGQGRLDSAGKQCCLGVKCLLDIAANRHGVQRRKSVDVEGYEFGYTDELLIDCFSVGMPMLEILHKWGISEDQAQALVLLNDGDGRGNIPAHSFEEIAQWIEDNIPATD